MRPLGRPVPLRHLAIVLTAVLGLLATFGAAALVLSWEYRLAEVDFDSRAKSFRTAINADLVEARSLLYTMAAFIESRDSPVSRREFERFSNVFRNRMVGLRDVGWSPRITLAERRSFERLARVTGYPGYRIFENGPHHRRISARMRPEYYPLLFTEAQSAKEHVVGFDILSSPVRAAAIERALRTGQPAATPPTNVMSVRRRNGGVIGYMAVGRSRVNTNAPVARGVVLGVFDVVPMIDHSILAKAQSAGLDLFLLDPAQPPGHRLIFWRPAAATDRPPPLESTLRSMRHSTGTIELIDQRWEAIVTPATPLRYLHWSPLAAMVFGVGLTMTAMIVAYLVVSLRRARRLEALTASLHHNAEQIRFMARHDALTLLPNRFFFTERIAEAIADLRNRSSFALLYLDLDHFKAVNDTLGHSAGDRLLRMVAERIASCLRPIDTVARLGGDEFAIIVKEFTTTDHIVALAQRLIATVEQPYVIDSHPVMIGVSIGIAFTNSSEATPETLLKQADLALYDAKDGGRGTFRFFEPHMQTLIENNLRIEHELRRGLENGEFAVHYQPIVNLEQNCLIGFEALVRWNHVERGLLPPEEFIALAEARGLIGPLGSWILHAACHDAARWPGSLRVAVNISPVQFSADGVLEDIASALRASGLPADRLEIEITEAAVLRYDRETLTVLNELRAQGVRVAFDDFGTGFSSLSSLLRFAFDKIKIDRSFIARLETSSSASAIVRAIGGLASNLGAATTAEGVETLEQLRLVRRMGCSEAQGYLYSPPRPNHELPLLIEALAKRLNQLDPHAPLAG